MSAAYVPARQPAATTQREDEMVVWPDGATAPTRLDALESLIYRIIDGVAGVDELVDDVSDTVAGVPPAVARARITEALDSFDCSGLLATTAAARPRRDLIFPYSTST